MTQLYYDIWAGISVFLLMLAFNCWETKGALNALLRTIYFLAAAAGIVVLAWRIIG